MSDSYTILEVRKQESQQGIPEMYKVKFDILPEPNSEENPECYWYTPVDSGSDLEDLVMDWINSGGVVIDE